MTEAMGPSLPRGLATLRGGVGTQAGRNGIVEAYARRLASVARRPARRRRCLEAWEDTHVALDPNFAPLPDGSTRQPASSSRRSPPHFFVHDGFRPGKASL